MTSREQNIDHRVSRAFEWISGALASIFVIVLVWVGSTLMAVQQDVAVVKVQIAPAANRMDRIEEKVENVQTQMSRVETKVATMEARQQRVIGE